MVTGAGAMALLAGFGSITGARRKSLAHINSARTALSEHSVDGLDVVAFGSLARLELTESSDFDFLVLATSLPSEPDVLSGLLSEADNVRSIWAREFGRAGDPPVSKPGPTGVFGQALGAFDLVRTIGLQGDTNHSLTRRMLLLEESVSLMNDAVHRSVVDATLNQYLSVGERSPSRVPRFLLNDVVRYWRTITVDYQAKATSGPAEAGLRYLKLLIPRKVLFAGTVMSLLLCEAEGFHGATTLELADQFGVPPLQRLVHGYEVAPGPVREAMETVCSVVDGYLERSADRAWRDRMKVATKASGDAEFDRMLKEASRLQNALEKVFFDWPAIGAMSRKMLAF